MKDLFGPLPAAVVVLMLIFGVALVLVMSVPSAWVFPFLRMFGVKIGEHKKEDGKTPSRRS